MAQWVVHLVLAPEVQAEAAEVGAQGATAEQVGGAATLAGDPLCLARTSGLGGAGPDWRVRGRISPSQPPDVDVPTRGASSGMGGTNHSKRA